VNDVKGGIVGIKLYRQKFPLGIKLKLSFSIDTLFKGVASFCSRVLPGQVDIIRIPGVAVISYLLDYLMSCDGGRHLNSILIEPVLLESFGFLMITREYHHSNGEGKGKSKKKREER
jgi:hypothetical protein